MDEKKIKVDAGAGQLGFILFLCYVGALVYFINQADGFLEVVFAVFQAIFWPAYLIYYSLEALGI